LSKACDAELALACAGCKLARQPIADPEPGPPIGPRHAGILTAHMTKPPGSLLPEHEGLRRAVEWLIEQPVRDGKTIEEAARRFDLSPVDEDFLLRHFRAAGAGRKEPE